MKVDCYNACNQALSTLISGDCFWYKDSLFILTDVNRDGLYAVSLSDGHFTMFHHKDIMVQKARVKVVCDD